MLRARPAGMAPNPARVPGRSSSPARVPRPRVTDRCGRRPCRVNTRAGLPALPGLPVFVAFAVAAPAVRGTATGCCVDSGRCRPVSASPGASAGRRRPVRRRPGRRRTVGIVDRSAASSLGRRIDRGPASPGAASASLAVAATVRRSWRWSAVPRRRCVVAGSAAPDRRSAAGRRSSRSVSAAGRSVSSVVPWVGRHGSVVPVVGVVGRASGVGVAGEVRVGAATAAAGGWGAVVGEFGRRGSR